MGNSIGGDCVIVLAGMIGAGKTVYTEMLAEEFGTKPFFESVDDNPILDKFYKDPKRWAFSLQIHFLNTRFKSIKEALLDRNNVLDRSIYEDKLFTEINHKQGNISYEEMKIYNDLLDNMMEELSEITKKTPDLLIYLHGSFDKILEQIGKRGRDFEQDEKTIDYFKLLWSHYDKWYDEYSYSPKMSISIDEFDVVNNPEDKKKVLKKIKKSLKNLK